MTKIVINRCFGGFGISNQALMILIKRNAKCIKKTRIDDYYGGSVKYKNSMCYSPDWKNVLRRIKNEFK